MDGAPRHLDPVTGPEHAPHAVEVDGELALEHLEGLVLGRMEVGPRRVG
jgi:hypothetical protein